MKKKLFCILLALMLALSLCTFASAADYGVIYDGTGELNSPVLTWQGEELLPLLTEMFEVDLRVDVLVDPTYDDPAFGAKHLFMEYEYGYGEELYGITLTIFLHEAAPGVYLMEDDDDWYLYAAHLGDDVWAEGGLATLLYNTIAPYFGGSAWNGEDITMTSTALSQIIDAMTQALTDYCTSGEYTVTDLLELAGYSYDESYVSESFGEELEPALGDGEEETFEHEPALGCGEEFDDEPDDELTYVWDLADILSYEQWESLEHTVGSTTKRYGCGVYIVTVDDYTEYGDDIYELAYQTYHNSDNKLGVGSGRDGILLLMSMEERDYALFVYGDKAEYAFNSYAQELLEDEFLDDFAEDDWFAGLSDYVNTCDKDLALARSGKPVKKSPVGAIAASVVIGLSVACIVCLSQKAKMHTVHKKVEANAYTAGDIVLTERFDQYTHTTETRRKIEKDSGSGSSSSRSGGGGSGRSGKF